MGQAVTAVVVLRPTRPAMSSAIEAMTEIQAAVKTNADRRRHLGKRGGRRLLPLTGLGKPDKKAVRDGFWEGAGRAVG